MTPTNYNDIFESFYKRLRGDTRYFVYSSDLSEEEIKELVEDAVFGDGPEINKDLLKNSYANAFLSDVNYYQIAENIINEAENEKEEAQGK